jgi:hypothetical protein
MLMGADDGAIEHQPFEIGVSTHFLEQPIDQTTLQPTIIAPFDCLEGAEIRWQVLPPRSGARHPKQRVDKTPVIRPGSTLALAATGDQRQNPRPLIVTKLISIQRIPPKTSFGIIILDQEHQARDELSPRPRTK